jgi:precorrin-2 dehydrogenase/sirohydrochlorin ferrochelatase
MIRLLHDLTDETVLVFGDRSVGGRKARRFGREADVVVGPSLSADDDAGAGMGRTAPEPAAVGCQIDRTDPAVVVPATDDGAVNGARADAAGTRGVHLNRAARTGGRAAGSVVVRPTAR